MDHPDDGIKQAESLREHLWKALGRSTKNRPMSFYLLLAMVVMLLLGSQIFHVKDDPKQFALFLSLYFLFFFVLIFRAILDAFDIARDHFREKERLVIETFAADGFADKLGTSVARGEKEGS